MEDQALSGTRGDVAAFNALFDRAASACAQAQRLVSRSSSAVKRARAERASNARLRRMVEDAMQAWASADAVHAVLKNEVERIVHELRAAGIDHRGAVATVRAHLRFVLYDSGLTEQDAEPVVQRASAWIEQLYNAA